LIKKKKVKKIIIVQLKIWITIKWMIQKEKKNY
jgi:hypothetical protein